MKPLPAPIVRKNQDSRNKNYYEIGPPVFRSLAALHQRAARTELY